MQTIPSVDSDSRELSQVQQNIINALTPILRNAFVNGGLLTSISLATGSNIVNHGLNRKLQGWVVVRIRASATIYDTQDTNSTPNKTLLLTASAPVVVDLYVF